MTTSSDHPPPQLDYARRQRRAWLARHRRKLIALALLLAIAGPVWWYWQPLKRQVLWLYWFHRATTHVMPPSIDASIVGPQVIQIAANNPDFELQDATNPTYPWAHYWPVAYRNLSRFDTRFRPRPLVGAMLFMGRLQRPDGAARLVVISGSQEISIARILGTVNVLVLPEPGLLQSPVRNSVSSHLRLPVSGAVDEYVTYKLAMADSQNPSHVVIPYSFKSASDWADPKKISGRGEIDAYLQNGDSLRFVLRGPGKLLDSQIAGNPLSPPSTSGRSAR